MPDIGQIVKGQEIGKTRCHKYIWIACPNCRDERWVSLYRGKPISLICRFCDCKLRLVGETNGNWKGGKRKDRYGYTRVRIEESSPFYSMKSYNYIAEHRLVMAQSLGRCLLKSEHVHHINGNRADNRIENLQILNQTDHMVRTQLCSTCELKKEIRLQRWQIKELTEQVKNLTAKMMGVT